MDFDRKSSQFPSVFIWHYRYHIISNSISLSFFSNPVTIFSGSNLFKNTAFNFILLKRQGIESINENYGFWIWGLLNYLINFSLLRYEEKNDSIINDQSRHSTTSVLLYFTLIYYWKIEASKPFPKWFQQGKFSSTVSKILGKL